MDIWVPAITKRWLDKQLTLLCDCRAANTMIIAVYERTREIGMLKAIGASRDDVLRLFIAGASCIGFLGGFLGLILGTLIGRGVDWAALSAVK